MKKAQHQLLLIFLLCLAGHKGVAQCPSVSTSITTNAAICGLYGDASGNSNWNWELGSSDPNYCSLWYARTNSTTALLTPMGSPFVNATVGSIDAISQKQDYTKAKGWELLQRDFGCKRVTSYPYFVLYNRYSGLMRIFIYQNESHLFSGMAVTIEPSKGPYPATTASADNIEAAPDKYPSTSLSSSTIGRSVLAVSDNLGGSNRWSVVEFNPSFDPYIANTVYAGTGLQVKIYGVQTYALQAAINGTLVSGSSPGLNVSPKNALTSSSGSTIFTAAGEKFTTFGKDLNDLKSAINSAAKGISDSLASVDLKSPKGKVKASADEAAAKTSTSPSALSQFTDIFGNVASILTGGASILKLAGDLVGLFTDGGSGKTPASAPVYTSVNLSLQGSLTLNDLAESFILRVPGTPPLDGNNATYYKCPLGIFNIDSTAKADTVVYLRRTVRGAGNTQVPFVAYRMANDIPVSYFDGTGLDLVSVQAAIMGRIQANSSTGKATYDPFAPDFTTNGLSTTINYMRPDLESGRLEIAFYDTSSAHLHLMQTPYVNLECIKGMSVNFPQTTTVSLRIKAILKRKDDPANTPILYIQDYQIDPVHNVTLDPAYRDQLLNAETSSIANPPFANYTVKPFWVSDRVLQNLNYTAGGVTESADNSLTANTSVTVSASAQGMVFQAGGGVYLEPNFVAETGSSFEASIYTYGQINPTCGTLQKHAFQGNGDCYNSTATGLAQKPGTKTGTANMIGNPGSTGDSSVNFYPIPAQESLTISGLAGWGRSTITVVDQTGKKLFSVYKTDESPIFQLNTAGLTSGIYFVEIQCDAKKLTHKIIIAR